MRKEKIHLSILQLEKLRLSRPKSLLTHTGRAVRSTRHQLGLGYKSITASGSGFQRQSPRETPGRRKKARSKDRNEDKPSLQCHVQIELFGIPS